MATYLDGIVAWHRARVAADDRDVAALFERAMKVTADSPPRDFVSAIKEAAGIAVIAEIKRRTPSKGPLVAELDVPGAAADYETGGAACLSVLTDDEHFDGSPEDLASARRSVRLPVLRKDFTLGLLDVYDARLMGADAVLLIAAVLTDDELAAFAVAANTLGMAALVEVHDEAEADRALGGGATLVGVNQRDLRTFEVDKERSARLGAVLGEQATKVAESGIASPADVARLAQAGYDAVLVGEAFVRAPDRVAEVRAFASAVGAESRSAKVSR